MYDNAADSNAMQAYCLTTDPTSPHAPHVWFEEEDGFILGRFYCPGTRDIPPEMD